MGSIIRDVGRALLGSFALIGFLLFLVGEVLFAGSHFLAHIVFMPIYFVAQAGRNCITAIPGMWHAFGIILRLVIRRGLQRCADLISGLWS